MREGESLPVRKRGQEMTVKDMLMGKDLVVSMRMNKKNYLCLAHEAVMVFGHMTVKAVYTNKCGTLTLRV